MRPKELYLAICGSGPGSAGAHRVQASFCQTKRNQSYEQVETHEVEGGLVGAYELSQVNAGKVRSLSAHCRHTDGCSEGD
jgi:hypothetical protein